MKRLTTRRAGNGRSRIERALEGAAGRVNYPELHFRAMAPSEALVLLAREQDALCRAVLDVDPVCSRVLIERRAGDRAATYDVFVRTVTQGVLRCGRAEHPDAASALREAYTQMMRHALQEMPCPCSEAA